MNYNYDKLWNLLDSKGLSKTDLRIRTGISTATLAKLSAGESVSLEVLSKISRVLGAGFDDIISVSEDEIKKWACIGTNRKFLVHIIFLVTESTAFYVLGYAVAYDMTDEGMNKWKITEYIGKENYYCIDGYAESSLLKELLSYALNGEAIGKFISDKNIALKGEKISQKIIDKAMGLKICNGNMEYHAPYILQHQNIRGFCADENMPAVSPYEASALCEGLQGKMKRSLYVANSRIDPKRLEELYSILREEFPNAGKFSNVGMLANFEIFSSLNGGYDENYGVNVVVERGGNTTNIFQTFKMVFDHTKIGKNIMVEFIGYNYDGVNPICDILKEVDCSRKDQTWMYNSDQPISRYELKIWDNDKHGNSFRKLVYHIGHSLVMEVRLDLNVCELSYNLKDEWDEIISKNGKTEQLRPQLVTRYNAMKIENENEDQLIKNDFRNNICIKKNSNKGGFFDRGPDKQVDFLIWLKNVVNEEHAEKIIIVDPYIKAKSVAAILRCINDYNVSVEIFLDKNKGGKNVNEIKSIKNTIQNVVPQNFSILAVSSILHDRYVILMGETGNRVYMLSNSIDSVAEKFASASVLVEENVATQIIRYYLELFSRENKEVIFQSRKIMNEESVEREKNYVCLPDDSRLPEKVDSIDTANRVINLFLEEGNVTLDSYEARLCINARHFLAMREDLSHDYLMKISSFIANRIEYEYFTWMSPILYEAVCFLKDNAVQDFFTLLDKMPCTFSNTEKERDMVYEFISMLNICAGSDGVLYSGVNSAIIEEGLKSDKVFFKALSITEIQRKLLGLNQNSVINMLHEDLSKGEFLIACVYFLERLKRYSKGYNKQFGEERISTLRKSLENSIAGTIGEYLEVSDKQDKVEDIESILMPIYMQQSNLISEIIVKAVQTGSVRTEFGQSVLVDFIMKRFLNYENAKSVYYSNRDLEESFKMIDQMYHISSETPSRLKHLMRKIEIGVSQKLYTPFLKDRDYSTWKKYIDVLCCMACLEIYISDRIGKSGTIRVLEELKEISENYDTLLQEYSDVYRTVKIMGKTGGKRE